MDFDQSPESGGRFRSTVSLQSLQEGTEIILDTENADFSSEDEDFFNEASLQTFKDELQKICTDSESDANLDLSSFEVLSEKMNPVTEDGSVRKLELRPGCGPIIPPKSLVLLHYNAYLEKQSVPFDSTYQRNSPFRFLLGGGRVVLGLDLGVATMKKGEVSVFLVQQDYAYGTMGCPPRVPPNAAVYYEVEILNYVDSADAIEFEEMTSEEKRRAPFVKILSACKAEHQMGNSLYQRKIYNGAASRYRKATNMLEDLWVADQEEDRQRQSLLVTLYMNLALCYLKLKNAKKSRINALNVLRLDCGSSKTKALFTLGRAYCLDGEYDDALRYLYKAQKENPYNEEINKQISATEKLMKNYREKEKKFCANIFGGKESNGHSFNESEEFLDSIRDCIKTFEESPDTEYCLPSGYTESQIEDIRTLVALSNVHLIEKIYDGKKICKLCK